MRILILTASYPPVLGGLQTAVHALACGLRRRRHEVLVVTNHYPVKLPLAERVDGVRVIRLPFITPRVSYLAHRPDLFFRGLVNYPVTRQCLSRLIRHTKPDVVNLHFPDGQTPFILALRRKFQFQLIVSLHGDDVQRYIAEGTVREQDARLDPEAEALKALLRDADAVTACSNSLLKLAAGLEPAVLHKGVVIHNGVDVARFGDQTTHLRPRPYVLAYGRLTHKKGFDLLFDAFAQLGGEHRDTELVLAGAGEELPALERQARRLGIAERVAFFGRASAREVRRLLNGCLFLVVPSRQEPFGIVALEGMAAGKAVIATRVGGLQEVVPQPPNLLVEPQVDQLKAALAAYLDQRALLEAIGAENRTHARKFTWDRAVERFLQVYQQSPAALEHSTN